MARNLEEFDALLTDAVKAAQATHQQDLGPEPLPVFDPATEATIRSINFMFDRVFGGRNA